MASGEAGAGAARTYRQLRSKWEDGVRARWGPFGFLALGLGREPQHIAAWASGAEGERIAARKLGKLERRGIVVLHDRCWPGRRRANIDHIAVAPTGVWVIDTKHYRDKRIELRGRRQARALWVGGRDRTPLVESVRRQADAIASLLGDVPTVPAICFVRATWPLAGALRVGTVEVVSPSALRSRLGQRGSLTGATIAAVAARLEDALPAA